MRIHLIRHGEVDNPANTVYADIPGFRLSAKGRSQATAAGRHLSTTPPHLLVSSPLDRAAETAGLIAAETGGDVVTDPRLSEWGLAVRWRGAAWAELPTVFPGELEAYLADPTNLPFCPESIEQVATRIATAVADWTSRYDEVAFVSHEDPIHATHLHLTGVTPAVFHSEKPAHCSVITLVPGEGAWSTAARWDPPQ